MTDEKASQPLTGAFYLGGKRLDTSEPETLEYVRGRFAAEPARPVVAVGDAIRLLGIYKTWIGATRPADKHDAQLWDDTEAAIAALAHPRHSSPEAPDGANDPVAEVIESRDVHGCMSPSVAFRVALSELPVGALLYCGTPIQPPSDVVAWRFIDAKGYKFGWNDGKPSADALESGMRIEYACSPPRAAPATNAGYTDVEGLTDMAIRAHARSAQHCHEHISSMTYTIEHYAMKSVVELVIAETSSEAIRYVPVTYRMAQDIAAMAKARPLAKLILAVPAEQTAEPQPISVYADTDLDPEPIGVVVP